MNENEKLTGLEANPYDALFNPAEEPVISPVILNKLRENENLVRKQVTSEIVPLADKAIYTKINIKNNHPVCDFEVIAEEDFLVPDTEPDMDVILNVDARIDSVELLDLHEDVQVQGKIRIETMYRSAESYGNPVNVISAKMDLCEKAKDLFSQKKTVQDFRSIKVNGRIGKIEYRVINERKYRIKISLQLKLRNLQETEQAFFEGIEGEEICVRRENIKLMNLASTRTKESEIHEELLIGDDKIRPVKILKSKFVVAENHSQLTSDKLIINQTIWVRILYLAEVEHMGTLSNQPMMYQGKIDNTQFVPLGKDEENVSSYIVCEGTELLTAEINGESTGFHIEGDIVNCIELYSFEENKIVTDFYHKEEDIICDRNRKTFCSGLSACNLEQTVNETISLQQESGQDLRVIYVDGYVTECAVEPNFTGKESKIVVNGKAELEVVTMNEGDYTVLAKKMCGFSWEKEFADGLLHTIEMGQCRIRYITAEVVGSNINVTAHIQVMANAYEDTTIECVENPCFTRNKEQEKAYPITVHTVKEGEEIWDIAKKYKVDTANISEINPPEKICAGKKVMVVR